MQRHSYDLRGGKKRKGFYREGGKHSEEGSLAGTSSVIVRAGVKKIKATTFKNISRKE